MTLFEPISRRGRRPFLPLALVILLTGPAAADADVDISIRPAGESPVELVRPADGEVLRGGRSATISWRPLRDLSADGIHEWEAFLSFDGGSRWPVRVTPHLEIELTSFRFTVPMVPSDDVRLMLRFGDEQREVGYVLPLRLRSVVPEGAWPPLAAAAFAPGEPARPGVPGVVLWVEGSRSGRGIRMRIAGWIPPSLRAVAELRDPLWFALIAPERHSDGSPTHRAEPSPARRDSPVAPFRRAVLRAVSLLLLVCRRDE